ncbi:MAG: D-alanine--D-alanine ligase [Candidatus Cloacimonetes bacterium]|nr:D-alanine--D-alanine ligase [Candidatus Cloacimonadota bacterium]
MKKIIILQGGKSEEREISLITGREIEKELISIGFSVMKIDPKQYSSYSLMIDDILKEDPYIVFNGLHGAEGEDGRIQALLSLNNIAYTGSDYRASAIAMDKVISSILAASAGVPIPKQYIINNEADHPEKITSQLDFPFVVKPSDSGSSFGISVVRNEEEINSSILEAFKFSNKVICEQFIPGRELTVTILGHQILPVVEIKPKNGWYDFKNKYTSGNTVYEVPAKLSDEENEIIKNYAVKVFARFGCQVYGRVDFRYDGERFYFLEVNTLPGMTSLSLTPMAAKEAGYSFGELLKEIIKLSIKT